MSDLIFQRHLPAKQRCDLCQRATENVYQINHEGYLLTFDSAEHARVGLTNWEEKKAKNIKPGVPFKEEVIEDLGENIGGDE
ncbi:hypothetical protein M0R04_14225 [Candidatus Dojkabacteria bacterium]|jgi:hypothetical protein|nr:hypothetical protein [Candidatus Dojkabacteria bacterium]